MFFRLRCVFNWKEIENEKNTNGTVKEIKFPT